MAEIDEKNNKFKIPNCKFKTKPKTEDRRPMTED
jgi:hypothetical protein